MDLPGYEFEITGGADSSGFPMRKDVEGSVRKKILIEQGVGIRNKEKGLRKRKTVRGNTINNNTAQISMKVVKAGKKPIKEEKVAEKDNSEEKKE